MIVAQLSDLHFRPKGFPLAFGRIDTTALARRAIARVAAMRPQPDVVIVTGDLADCGRHEEYEMLKESLAPLRVPTLLVPGNHDDRNAFQDVFADWPGLDFSGGFVQFCAEYPALRIIGLDTLIPGEGRGSLCKDRLAWLSDKLSQRPDASTLIAMHHPPIKVGGAFLDAVRLIEGVEELRQIVVDNPQIIRLLCGHHHRSIDAIFGGALASVGPAVVNAVHLELGDSLSVMAIAEPPAFKLHLLSEEGELVSHTVFIEEYGGPFPAPPDPDYPAMASFAKETASR